jgi:Flp pilus assembly protein TadD
MTVGNDSIEPGRQLARSESFSLVRRLLPAAVLAATFLAYVDTLVLGFVFDDHVLIVTNDSIRSWRYFPSYFTSHIWSFRYPHLLANYYRPLFLTWLRLNDAVFGLYPWGWHLTSVLAHVAVTYLVYRLALRLTRDRWVAGAAGLIFGLHPVHAEAVADITSIQEPLSTFFILAAMLAFARSREPVQMPAREEVARASRPLWQGRPARAQSWPGWPSHQGWLAAALALTAAALLSKESGMVLPILVFGFAWIYGGAGDKEVSTVEKGSGSFARLISALSASVPFWLVVLVYMPLRIRALKGFAHVITPLPLSTVIFTIPSVLIFYLRLVFWPFGLSCYYDMPYVSNPGWNNFILPAVLLGAVTAVVGLWYLRARQSAPEDARAIAFAGLWMVLTLVPVLNFRFLPEGEIAHDRYVYLSSVGFVILVAMALRALIRNIHHVLGREKRTKDETRDLGGSEAPAFRRLPDASPRGEPSGLSRPAWLLALVLFAAMGFATARQNLFWSDDLTLNYRAHEIAPHNVNATTSLAAAVAERGMEGTAMALYQRALAVQPKFWRANVNLAYLEYARGNYTEAARYYSLACAADPTDGDQFLYLGMALLRMGRFGEAEKAVRSALLVRPQGKAYHLGLGMVLRGEGKLNEARQEIAAELGADPQNAQARALLDQITRQMDAQTGKPDASKPSRDAGIDLK